MQIYGIGSDIVKIARIEKLWQEHGDKFAQRILTSYELAAFAQLKTNHVAFLAKRFAAKEAISKALGTGFSGEVLITQLGIETDVSGKPKVAFYASTKKYVESLGLIDLQVSISDEEDYVVAFAIVLKA